MKIGTAGWSFSKELAHEFAGEGSVLERYAKRFPAVEINSSFHRPHRDATWAKWRNSVPPAFRFSVKLPKTISHQQKLRDCDELLDEFLGQLAGLGDKLGVLLLQLPPKLEYDPAHLKFLIRLSNSAPAPIVCEPRHISWFSDTADQTLQNLKIGRVAANPALAPIAARPGGWEGLRYFRLHGSPVIYRSSYADRIDAISNMVMNDEGSHTATWCIFDNTASSAATSDALALRATIATKTKA